MKIKHWQGYGYITAKVLDRKHLGKRNYVDIKVYGNHEQGLDRSDFKEDVFEWLKRVIKNKELDKLLTLTGPEGYQFYVNSVCNFEAIYGQKDENGEYLDMGIYHLEFDDAD